MSATIVDEYFLIPPDWESTISLKRKWITVVQSSITKREKRSADITWPRRTLSFLVSAMDYEETAYIKRKIYKSLDKIYGVPLWMHEMTLSSSTGIGVSSFSIGSTDYKNIEVGGEIVILTSKNNYEILIVESFTSNTIVTTEISTKAWTENITGIFVILKGRLSSPQLMQNTNSRYSNARFELAEDYDEVTRYTPSIASYPTFNSYPILNTPPNWAGNTPTEFNHDLGFLQFYGTSDTLTSQGETEMKFQSEFLMGTDQETQNIMDFFDVHKGRWGAFWRSTWMEDLKITSAISSSDQSITIEDIDFSDYWLDTNAGKWIMIIYPDYSYYIGGVTDAVGPVISLDTIIGKDVSIGELDNLLVCFLHLSRFTHDELEVKYTTDSITTIQMNFTTLLNELNYPDVV